MTVIELVRSLFETLARRVAARRRLSEFACGDCSRWQRCGLPPITNCVYRAAEIASDDWRERRRKPLIEPW